MFWYNFCIVFACEWNVFLFHFYDPIKQCFWIFATRSLCHRKKTGVSNDPSKLQCVYTFSVSAFVWCSIKESASFLFIFSCRNQEPPVYRQNSSTSIPHKSYDIFSQGFQQFSVTFTQYNPKALKFGMRCPLVTAGVQEQASQRGQHSRPRCRIKAGHYLLLYYHQHHYNNLLLHQHHYCSHHHHHYLQ